jgi:hypothetical protein
MRFSQNTLNTKQPAKVSKSVWRPSRRGTLAKNMSHVNVSCHHYRSPLLPIFQVRLLGTKCIKLITKTRAMISLVIALLSYVVTPYSI